MCKGWARTTNVYDTGNNLEESGNEQLILKQQLFQRDPNQVVNVFDAYFGLGKSICISDMHSHMAFQIGTSNIAFQIVIKMHFKFVWGEVGWGGLGRERENLTRWSPSYRSPPRKRLHNEKKHERLPERHHGPCSFHRVCRRLAFLPTDRGPHKSASFAIHLWDHY